MKLFVYFFIFMFLMQAFNEGLAVETAANSLSKMHREHAAGIHKKHYFMRKIDCGYACARRCSKSSRKNVCSRACKTCCFRCQCVPPGTSGNKNACPCYARLKTHGNRPKCP